MKRRLLLAMAVTGVVAALLIYLRASQPATDTAGVAVEEVRLESAAVRPDGRIWGEFAVSVTLRNLSATRLDEVKLLVDQLANNRTYKKLLPTRRSLVETAGPLAPGERVTVGVGPFRPFHPELDQEIVVNALSDRMQPGSVRKLPYLAVFPPGSAD